MRTRRRISRTDLILRLIVTACTLTLCAYILIGLSYLATVNPSPLP